MSSGHAGLPPIGVQGSVQLFMVGNDGRSLAGNEKSILEKPEDRFHPGGTPLPACDHLLSMEPQMKTPHLQAVLS
jgi:hypothetical protein